MLVALVSIVVALGLTAILGQAFDLSVFVVNMISGMGLALGIDYSLFVVSRYREERRHGHEKRSAIVNVGSVNSFLGFPTGSAYVTSKHGLIGLTSSASAELAPQGIRVNLLCPGFIDTPMHRRGRAKLGDEIYDKFLSERVHRRRAGRPEEIAETIVFLCSDAASYITGATLTPDGGFTLTV